MKELARPFPVSQHIRYPDGTIDVSFPEYVASSRAYLPKDLVRFVGGLEVALPSVGRKVVYGSLARRSLKHVLMQERVLPEMDMIGAENIPLVMRYVWDKRFSDKSALSGQSEKVCVISQYLRTGGADYDRKTVGFDPNSAFEKACEYVGSYYTDSGNVFEIHCGKRRVYWGTESNINERRVEIQTVFNRSSGNRMEFTQDLVPLTTITAGKVPNRPGISYLAVDIGLGEEGKDNPSEVVFKGHWTSMPPYGSSCDLRMAPGNSNWQRGITGDVIHGENVVRFSGGAVEIANSPLNLPDSDLKDPEFVAQELIRSVRMIMLENTSLDPKDVDSEKRARFADGAIGMSEKFHRSGGTKVSTSKDGALCSQVNNITRFLLESLKSGVKISSRLQSELLADIAACLLYSPLSFVSLMNETELYKLFNGTSQINPCRIGGVLDKMTEGLANYFGDGTLDSIESNYRLALSLPKVVGNGGKEVIEWEVMPDGLSLCVNALDDARRTSFIPVIGSEFSIYSRFAYFFSFVGSD